MHTTRKIQYWIDLMQTHNMEYKEVKIHHKIDTSSLSLIIKSG